MGKPITSPVIIHVVGFDKLPLTDWKKKKLRRDALGRSVGDLNGSVFDVGIEDNDAEFSIVFYERNAAAIFLRRLRAIRRRRWWQSAWLEQSWLRVVSCCHKTLCVQVNSSRGNFLHTLRTR